jgi:cobalt-precorrin 5A hydrolase
MKAFPIASGGGMGGLEEKLNGKGIGKVAVLSLDSGKALAQNICEALVSMGFDPIPILASKNRDKRFISWRWGIGDLVSLIFDRVEAIVGIVPMGVMVRVLAPNLKNKHDDPGVIVVDHEGRYVISVASEHRIADGLSRALAEQIGAQSVITSRRRRIAIGIGSRRGIAAWEVVRGVEGSLRAASVDLDEVKCIATIDLKRDEAGILEAAKRLQKELLFISGEELKNYMGSRSEKAREALGVEGVCEQAALAVFGGNGRLIMNKRVLGGLTIAMAEEVE